MMKNRSLPGARAGLVCLVTAVLLMAFFTSAVPVLSDGGIAMSGSFYQQNFRIPQGSSISGPDVYVVVFNNSGNDFRIRMTGQTPPGVRLVLSQDEFDLPASGQMQVQVGVEVGMDAAPGEYDISIIAEPYKETGAGIQLIGAASQKAVLTVLGESGLVSVQATSPDGQPISAIVRLFRMVSGREYEVGYSENGFLEMMIAPGSFTAASYLGGTKVAEERFDIAAGESKEVNLSGATVYFEGFDIVPNYQKSDGNLAFVQLVYTIKNLYQRIEKSDVILKVNRDEGQPVELLLAAISPLETGRVGLNYNYIPAEGWEKGNYNFKLQLNLDGKPYADSLVQQLMVSGGENAVEETRNVPEKSVTAETIAAENTKAAEKQAPVQNAGSDDDSGGQPVNPYVVVGIVAAVLLAAGILIWFMRKTRRA
ncbi:MAG: hypothetical protein JXA46_18870 [Dehalococcoidales bacterium]|nr:hypothetical protein [Dehalococcoidales bacterium]